MRRASPCASRWLATLFLSSCWGRVERPSTPTVAHGRSACTHRAHEGVDQSLRGTRGKLNALDLQIEAGATGLLGANGAGKINAAQDPPRPHPSDLRRGLRLGHDIRTEGQASAAHRLHAGIRPDPRMDGIHQVRYAGELLGMNPVVAMQRLTSASNTSDSANSATVGLMGTPLACGRPPNSPAPSFDPEMIIADEPSTVSTLPHVISCSRHWTRRCETVSGACRWLRI